MNDLSPLQLAELLRHKKDFIWLDSLIPQASSHPREQGLSLLAAEPDLILEGGPHDWHFLEEELKHRSQDTDCRLQEDDFSLTQLFHRSSYEKGAKTDEARTPQDSDLASTNSYLSRKKPRLTQHPSAFSPSPIERNKISRLTSSFNFNCCGAAVGFFRYDGSFRFAFYPTVYRHLATEKKSKWLTPVPKLKPQKSITEETFVPLSFQDNMTRNEFCHIVREAQHEITLGNIYQICLSHCFQAPCQADPWPLYLSLRQHSPAPFAAYLQCGKETILSSSPECFLKMEGRHILTRPIKGTRPRGKNPTEDAEQAIFLQASLKENAELVMITDLERNDLGRVCEYGSVVTSELLHLERYPQIFHLVSTIQGQLRKEVSHIQALAACFPGGSISGAPKKKAIEIIQRLELEPRGLFTGAIGYFGFDGTSQFNIAIRTLHLHNGIAQFHVGAGITSDSIPEQEWEETLHKAAGILIATQSRYPAAVEV